MLVDDYARLEAELGGDPRWAECVGCISDVRRTTASVPSAEELKRLSDGRPQRVEIEGKRIAYLALPGEQTGKIQRYIHISGTGHLAAVVSSVEEAYAWLAQDQPSG